MTLFELNQRRVLRQQMCFQAALLIREKLGGSAGPLEERMEHVRVAAIGAVAEARGVMHALRVKGLITEREEQDALDWGYTSLLQQIESGLGAKVFEGGGHG